MKLALKEQKQEQPVIIALERDDDGDVNIVASKEGKKAKLAYICTDGKFHMYVDPTTQGLLKEMGFILNEGAVEVE